MLGRIVSCFVIVTAAGLLAAAAPVKADEEPAGKEKLKQMRESRKKAAHRRRRIIFNNDGDDAVYCLDEATPKALLDARTTPLLGSQVDTIFYCTWSSGFSYFTHNTKIGQVFDTTANPKHPANKGCGFARNKTADFIKQGTDPLKIMVEFCKKNDIEIFWSFRMNDTHDAWGSWYGDYLFPKLKKDHPEWLVAGKAKRSKHGGWSAMDFSHQEVRDLAVKFIEEVCRNYDVDGIEMDFFRHPIYFKKPAWGEDAGPEELEKMTSMIRRVREVTEREALKRGRPILVAVRVPDSVPYCRAMGLDIERWLKEGLVDLMAVSGYFRLNPWEVSVSLGHNYDVPVYCCLSETRIRDPQARKVRASMECYRGRAMNVWDSGADGVYMFNAFNPRSPLWRELGDPKTLAPLDKVYVVGARGVAGISRWMENGEERFLNRPKLSPERPVKLQPGKTETVDVRVGEDLAVGKDRLNVTAQVRVHALADAAGLSVKLNGKPLTGGKLSKGWVEYVVDPAQVKRGVNRFEITLAPGSAAGPVLQDLLLWVRHKK